MMGIFGDEIERLLREDWTPKMLAEEIYAILSTNVPLQVSGPITITNPTDQPAIQINDSGGSPQTIQINKQPLQAPQFPALPPIESPTLQVPGSPGINLNIPQLGVPTQTNFYPTGAIENWTNPPALPQPGTGTIVGGGGGGGFPGQVQDGGPGKGPYTCTIYPTGLSGSSKTVQAMALQVDDSATIPTGTWALFTLVSTHYYFQPAVWM